LKPITDRSDIPSDQRAKFDAIVAVLHRVSGPFSMLMHSLVMYSSGQQSAPGK